MDDIIFKFGYIVGLLLTPLLTVIFALIIFVKWCKNERSEYRFIAWFSLISSIVLNLLFLLSNSFSCTVGNCRHSFTPSIIILLLILLLLFFEGYLLYRAWIKNDNAGKKIAARLGLMLPIPLSIFSLGMIFVLMMSFNIPRDMRAPGRDACAQHVYNLNLHKIYTNFKVGGMNSGRVEGFDERYFHNGYIDYSNEFGDIVHKDFSCVVEYDDNEQPTGQSGDWKIVDFEIE
jgi:hypothetical protein